MKRVCGYPPNIEKIKEAFPITDETVFTYGDTIYTTSKESLPLHLLAHEKVHERQQGDNPEAWWDRYIEDPKFRLSQEIEAYRVQYANSTYLSKINREDLLRYIAQTISSPLYGNMIEFEEALVKIKHL